MTNWILKWLIPGSENAEDPAVRGRIGSLSGAVGIFCNFLLFALKLLAGILTGGLSIVADALNNLSDASGSVVTLLGFKLAEKPADADHPYGHARFEYLSGLAVAVMILFIGFELAKSSVSKIFNPEPVDFTPLAAAILLFSIALKFWLCRFNKVLGTKLHSTTLLATAADSCNDCVATSAVLAAGIIEGLFQVRVDGYMGLGVALFILYSGMTLAKDTISPILGENADPQLRQQIADYIGKQPKVLGYHDLMVHDYGPSQRLATIHVEMDHREDPMACHILIDKMERSCMKLFHVHLVIHYDPVVVEDEDQRRLKDRVAGWLWAWDEGLTVHDFRTVPGKKHINLLFDVSLPEALRGKEEAITAMLETRLAEEPEQYHLIVTYDMESFNL